MGATITTGKRAAAFRTNAGDVRYVLYEQTYCKNTYPHTPRWECGAIGSVEQVLRYVFRGAADCEGGMLRSQSGPLTPEGYIAGWLVELAAPRRIVDREIPLEVEDVVFNPVAAAQVVLARRQHIDRETPRGAEHRQAGRAATQAPQHQRRIERDG